METLSRRAIKKDSIPAKRHHKTVYAAGTVPELLFMENKSAGIKTAAAKTTDDRILSFPAISHV